jgi:hypothetical protein
MNTLIANCITAARKGEDMQLHTTKLREKLHEVEFSPWLDRGLIKKSKVLEEDGLCQILNEANKRIFRWDIVADAEALWTRWMRGDIEYDLMRGVKVTRGSVKGAMKKHTSYKLKPDYTLKKSANVVGLNDLVNGVYSDIPP